MNGQTVKFSAWQLARFQSREIEARQRRFAHELKTKRASPERVATELAMMTEILTMIRAKEDEDDDDRQVS
jgi:hypothetical protein